MDNTTYTNTSKGAPIEASNTGPTPGRRYRPRGQAVRDQRLTPRFTDAELSEIKAAADAARMTLTGFCALAALAVARRQPGEPSGTSEAPAGVEELAALARELFAARTAVNRTGVNLNQAVAALNATGQPPVWLEHAVDRVTRAVAEVDTVVAQLHRRLA
ncbi:hypothetical protein RB614_15820 [Phytohabitans sp. ZYX-F-186]|uniref:Bacterial mobilisation domain-containing protein n=1 Tax=Phytohabitans maris TaxID=3071409 RepID=A0ABU0ZG14_9ACTN|nr:hypothetical protein [Phytohabitans sp. ZYX-F-186]MDQ7905980.1 hypothetical protein [Phytohabitans sp. ZYX-F-186]